MKADALPPMARTPGVPNERTIFNGLGMWTAGGKAWVVAKCSSEAAATYIFELRNGHDVNPEVPATWTEEPPDKLFRYQDYGSTTVVEHTFADWVRKKGRGWVASTGRVFFNLEKPESPPWEK